jgi:cob(I)alamin adenosyltransferase
MIDVPYEDAEKNRVLGLLDELQSKIENISSRLDDPSILQQIDSIMFLIQERDMSLSQEVKDYLNETYMSLKTIK